MRVTHPDLQPPEALAQREFELIVKRLADDLASGTDSSFYVGPGLEYAQSRPYSPGDPIKQMDWRVTARTGELYIKEYDALKRISVYLIVDTSASMSFSSIRLSKLDLAIWIAAALGLVAQRRLSPVTILSGGARDVRTAPSLASSVLWRALDELRHPDSREKTALAERLDLVRTARGSRGLVLILSDLHEPEALDAIRNTAQKHDVIVIQLLDPAERGRLRGGFLRGVEAETGQGFLATGWTRFAAGGGEEGVGPELAPSGIDHLLLPTDEAFIPRLRHFLGGRSTRLRG